MPLFLTRLVMLFLVLGGVGYVSTNEILTFKRFDQQSYQYLMDSYEILPDMRGNIRQDLKGVFLYNELRDRVLPIEVRIQVKRDTIHHYGVYLNGIYYYLNRDIGYGKSLKIEFVEYDGELALAFEKRNHRVLVQSEYLQNQEITECHYQADTMFCTIMTSDLKLIQQGAYQIVPLPSPDTIIRFDPFSYEEHVRVVRTKQVKTGAWHYYDNNGRLKERVQY